MASLKREIERWAAAFVAQELSVAARMSALADRIRADATPELTAILPDDARAVAWRMSSNEAGVRELADMSIEAIGHVPALLDALARDDFAEARAAQRRMFTTVNAKLQVTGDRISYTLQLGADAPITFYTIFKRSNVLARVIAAFIDILDGGSAQLDWVYLAAPTELVEETSGRAVRLGADERLLRRPAASEDHTAISERGDSYLVDPSLIGRRVPVRDEPDSTVPFGRATVGGPLGATGQYSVSGLPKEALLEYLRGCPIVLAARTQVPDRHSAEGAPITVAYSTDGAWIWSAEATAYVDRYDLELPPAMLRSIADRNGEVPSVSSDRMQDAAQWIERATIG